MNVNETPQSALGASAIAVSVGMTSDVGSAAEANGDTFRRAAPVAGRRKRGVLPVSERPPHPGQLTWVDPTDEVCTLARGGLTVEAIADASGLTRSQVEGVLSANGIVRRHAPHRKTAPRTFDRAQVRAAHAAGESRNAIAARLGISLSSVSKAVNERVSP